MTDEEINLAIAETCGWQIPKGCVNYRINPSGKTIFFDRMSDVDPVPDYCNDLNAMHEAEKAISDVQQVQYCIELNRMSFGTPNQLKTFSAYHATSRQRAEAFLRTIGKWRTE